MSHSSTSPITDHAAHSNAAAGTSPAKQFFLLAFCIAIFLWTAAYPFTRAFLLTNINYNEGWNVYNAQTVAAHQPLYASTYGWTTVNYPALSFHLIAVLGKSASDYLFAGRMLSLAGLCLTGLFAALIVGHTTRSRLAACLSGLLLVAIFCATAPYYVGMDDPQILAQAFFMAALYAYLRGNRCGWALELSALLFVLGGNIKHNLIEFPLAVLLDLLFTSPRRAVRFAIGGALMAAASIFLTNQIDGPDYLSCLLAPRGYSLPHIATNLSVSLLPLLLPLVAAWWTACICWKNPSRRVLTLLLFCALPINAFFSGGQGVMVNGFFGSMLAIALLTGIFWTEYSQHPWARLRVLPKAVVCAIFFLWLAVPMIRSGKYRPEKALQLSRKGEQLFAVEVAELRQQPGPALCESLLLCSFAGKPYLYDPFNATRFIDQRRLDANVMVDRLRNHDFGAVQVWGSVNEKLAARRPDSHFSPAILRAIQQYYHPGFKDEEGTIYLPWQTAGK